MPFQGNGTFARIYRWQNDAANGLDILADRFDAEDDGFATGLSNCITRDGQSPPTTSIPWGNQNLTGVNNLTGVSFSFAGTGTVGGALGVTGNMTVGGTLGVTAGATFAAGVTASTPNAGTTGGVRVAGNATSGNAILQFVDSTLSSQWGYISITSAGIFNFSAPAGFAGGLVAGTTISDGQGAPTQRPIGYRGMPVKQITTAYTVTVADVGFLLEVGAGGSITLPRNSTLAAGTQFAPGDTILIQETANGTKSISPAASTNLYWRGTSNTGGRTLSQRGLCSVSLAGYAADTWFIGGDIS